MEKRTAEIIMVLKGHHELGERDTLKGLLAAYLAARCKYPERRYNDAMLMRVTQAAVIDFMRGCSVPHLFLYDYFEAQKWDDELTALLTALQNTDVRDDNGVFISGFTEENTQPVCKEKGKCDIDDFV